LCLDINRGDVVLWAATAAGAPGFAVYGQSEQDRFDSAEIGMNGMYSHAFGLAGEFEWGDAHVPGLHGTIIVEAHPRCRTHGERQAYAQVLGKGTVVTIEDGQAYPDKVRITVGQTVFFAVKSGRGVSIVDKTLLRAFLNPQPLPPGRQ
jgi:plastocyanin